MLSDTTRQVGLQIHKDYIDDSTSDYKYLNQIFNKWSENKIFEDARFNVKRFNVKLIILN